MSDLGAELKVRVSQETRAALEQIAAARREGTKLSDILRDAIGDYIDSQSSCIIRETPPPPVKKTRKRP